jgi:hypothetical protein
MGSRIVVGGCSVTGMRVIGMCASVAGAAGEDDSRCDSSCAEGMNQPTAELTDQRSRGSAISAMLRP